jgi:hypothetical protein
MTAPALTLQRLLWQTLLKTRGEIVTYRATGFELAEITVVITRPGEDQVNVDDNFVLESKQWDVLIDPATLLTPAGDQFEPSLGHQIIRTGGIVYRVKPGDSAKTCWRWSDGLHTWRRVHTVIDT